MEYAYLSEVFPNYEVSPKVKKDNTLPVYSKIAYDLDVKPYQKLMIKNGKLQVDNRNFQHIKRKISGDNRWKILEHLIILEKTYNIDSIKTVLTATTYSTDKKWCERLSKSEIIQIK